jgi:hypothetical protein
MGDQLIDILDIHVPLINVKKELRGRVAGLDPVKVEKVLLTVKALINQWSP